MAGLAVTTIVADQSLNLALRRANRRRVSGLYSLFQEIDLNDDGSVSLLELRLLWKLMFPDLSIESCCSEPERVFRVIDQDKNMRISWGEMLDYFDACPAAASAADSVVNLLYEEDGEDIIAEPRTPREWLWAVMEQSSAN
eukprot:gene17207-5798_t